MAKTEKTEQPQENEFVENIGNVKVDDRLPKLEAQIEQMLQSVESAKDVQTLSQLLITILGDYQEKNNMTIFDEFIRDNKTQIESITKSIDTLNHRINCLEKAMSKIRDDYDKEIVNLLLNGLGAFEQR